MAGITVTLTLDQEQRLHFFAHLMTYLFCRTLPCFDSPPEISIDLVQEVGSRFLHLHADAREVVTFALTPEEGQAVKDLLVVLEAQYEQWPKLPESVVALKHLHACHLLLQEAEEQARKNTERG